MFEGVERTLADVQATDKNIDLKVKVLSINPKTVTVQGTEKEIYYGLFADTSMVRPFTAWNDFQINKNDIIQVKSAYVKDWRGELQINLGNTSSVETIDDASLAALDSSSIPTSLPSTEYKVEDLNSGLSNITMIGRILSVDQRTVTVDGQNKDIYTGTIADDTGKLAYTAWSNFDLKPGEVIKVTGAYIRSWRGVPKLNFDDRMELERLDDDVLPSIDELDLDKNISIITILEKGGGMDISAEGTILDIKEGSGLIWRCPECKRVLRNNECMVHGAQEGVPDLRVKCVIDDGSGAIIAVLNADLTSKLLGKTVEECIREAKDKGPDYPKSIMDELDKILLLTPLHVKGTVTTDDYGAMMICTDVEQIVISEGIHAQAKYLLENINSDIMTSDYGNCIVYFFLINK